MAKGDDIRERLVGFAVEVMNLCDELPQTTAGNHLGGQLLRSATSAAPNYAEARGAESPRDFLHKLGIALKELNETEVWLDMILKRRMADETKTARVRQECYELCRILAASVRTVSSKLGKLRSIQGS
jgi:four helix bundle protein